MLEDVVAILSGDALLFLSTWCNYLSATLANVLCDCDESGARVITAA